MMKYLSLLLLCLGAFYTLFLDSAAPSLKERLNFVDAYLASEATAQNFSGSILIAKKGKVLLSKGYGFADLNKQTPHTPQKKYLIGSITKQFTALAIMQLEEKGLISVKDPLKKYIPTFPGADKITIHHLLTHTAGIPNYTRFPEFMDLITQAPPLLLLSYLF